MQEQPETKHEGDDPAKDHEESLNSAIRESEKEKNSRYYKAREYFAEWGNRVGILTLLFVAAYTVITYDAFFVGNRAFIYLEKTVISILDKPVNTGGNVFNLPSVTHRVVSFGFLLTNSGNTPTRNMRVILDCRPVSFVALRQADPFTLFKWDEKIAHPEIVGPKQTIEVGPCEAETAGDVMLNAQMGTFPIILMGEIRYEDRVAWGKWARHVTQFSQRLIVTSFDAKQAKIEAKTQSIGRHNCADEDCPQ
jgi:hypothetical protein